MTPNKITLISIIGQRNLVYIFSAAVLVFVLLSLIFIEFEAFEAFYEFSRGHEDWELDDLILVFLSLLIAVSMSSFFASLVLSRFLIQYANDQMELQEKISHSRKIQSMGSLLGGISHSLNNHLVPILTISRMIKQDYQQDKQLQHDISQVLKAANSAKAILRKVLNFTRVEEMGDQSGCTVDESLNIAVDLAATAVPSAIRLEREIIDFRAKIPVSQVDFEVIILNLITNSVDAIDGAGVIRVSLQPCRFSEKQGLATPTGVSITVRDDGEGMTADQAEKIFDPFYTTKEQGKGTGLGLAETYGIITAALGNISVESKLGEYTQITINLPIIDLNKTD